MLYFTIVVHIKEVGYMSFNNVSEGITRDLFDRIIQYQEVIEHKVIYSEKHNPLYANVLCKDLSTLQSVVQGIIY